jgi:choline kinase
VGRGIHRREARTLTIEAVVIAAGRGQRLAPFTKSLPKPLLRIRGKPLLDYTMDALRKAGINHCIIITGYMGHALRRHIGDGSRFDIKVKCCYNPTYADGNATSLKAAHPLLSRTDRFLLLMADHLIDEEIVKTALANKNKAPLLCVDYRPTKFKVEEATKVLVGPDGYVRDIGKGLASWNALDTGVFLLNYQIFNVIKQIEHRFSRPLTISKCMKQMIEDGKPLWACDVSGCFWLDIDTLDDLVLAERLLGE